MAEPPSANTPDVITIDGRMVERIIQQTNHPGSVRVTLDEIADQLQWMREHYLYVSRLRATVPMNELQQSLRALDRALHEVLRTIPPTGSPHLEAIIAAFEAADLEGFEQGGQLQVLQALATAVQRNTRHVHTRSREFVALDAHDRDRWSVGTPAQRKFYHLFRTGKPLSPVQDTLLLFVPDLYEKVYGEVFAYSGRTGPSIRFAYAISRELDFRKDTKGQRILLTTQQISSLFINHLRPTPARPSGSAKKPTL
ncbi:hypothetical protein [Microvirga splendida]|uniref:Uncharacterized protein n=1 Tax=Microvirga splendida TaxID=2795727 RepID=A0ABS0Y8H1_9HYPH|nr:hypothetical protein [Microvirga splendida]MBJ6128370.1 hypothetical protein [Microvirga splendida]